MTHDELKEISPFSGIFDLVVPDRIETLETYEDGSLLISAYSASVPERNMILSLNPGDTKLNFAVELDESVWTEKDLILVRIHTGPMLDERMPSALIDAVLVHALTTHSVLTTEIIRPESAEFERQYKIWNSISYTAIKSGLRVGMILEGQDPVFYPNDHTSTSHEWISWLTDQNIGEKMFGFILVIPEDF